MTAPPDPPTILVVEDEAITAMALQMTLTEMGYRVPATAATGEDAIARARELAPDAVLMDIRLKGGMDGITAAETIRREVGAPIVYLTAYSDPETLRRARVTEPYGYIVKPYNEKELRAILEIAVHKGAMERARRRDADRLGAQVLQALIDANPAPIYLTGPRGDLVLVNRRFEETYGVSRRELATARLPPALAEADARALREGAVAGASDAIRLPLQRADGTTYALCTILAAAEGAPAARAAGELARAIEAREPRPPRATGAEALATHHADISAEARALAGSLRRMLSGLFHAGRPASPHVRDVDLTALAEDAAREVAHAARAGDADVRIEPGLAARGDPVLLHAILRDLLRNAFAFPRPGVPLVVHVGAARAPEGETAFFVRDNGKGFDPRLGDDVFRPFARSVAPEVGLALSAARGLVEQHGGRIWAEGAPEGGMVLYVSLPAA